MRRSIIGTALATGLLSACGGGQVELPTPRSIVTREGARITADRARMQEVHEWVTRAVTTINEDPSFWLLTESVPEPRYPWETYELVGLGTGTGADTVRIAFESRAPDAQTTYWMYAFLHLMQETGRMDEWFPEAVALEGYELERFIVERTADSWLLGRSVFDTQPYKPLDELVYAQDAGMLEALIFASRPDDFDEAREAYYAANPGIEQEFEEWYRNTFEGDPPGSR